MTITELEAQIAELQRQLLDAQRPPPLPVYQVGDQLRVTHDSRAGRKAPHIGDVGTVVAVIPKELASVVYQNCRTLVYLLDFGPDEDAPSGRDTWGFADGDVLEAEAAYQPRKGRKKYP